MRNREKEALQELHSDPKDVLAKKKAPVVIQGINFRAVNEIYDTRTFKKKTDSKSVGPIVAQKKRPMTEENGASDHAPWNHE